MKKGQNLMTFLLIIGLLGIFITIRVYKEYDKDYVEKRTISIKNQIAYKAKRCYIESKCENDSTISDLYRKGYIKDDIISPKTGKLLNLDTKILYDGENVKVLWDEDEI